MKVFNIGVNNNNRETCGLTCNSDYIILWGENCL